MALAPQLLGVGVVVDAWLRPLSKKMELKMELRLRAAVAALQLADPDRPCKPDEAMALTQGRLESHLQAARREG